MEAKGIDDLRAAESAVASFPRLGSYPVAYVFHALLIRRWRDRFADVNSFIPCSLTEISMDR